MIDLNSHKVSPRDLAQYMERLRSTTSLGMDPVFHYEAKQVIQKLFFLSAPSVVMQSEIDALALLATGFAAGKTLIQHEKDFIDNLIEGMEHAISRKREFHNRAAEDLGKALVRPEDTSGFDWHDQQTARNEDEQSTTDDGAGDSDSIPF